MSTEPTAPRRLAVVLAGTASGGAAPPGVDPSALRRAALADSYEVVADLVGVSGGIAGPPEVAELLWPGGVHLPDLPLVELAGLLAPDWEEVVAVAGDVPDLPGIVLAKVFKVLHRSDVVVAPARGGGCVAVGLRLPLAPWLGDQYLDLDADLATLLPGLAPRRSACASAPDWHRLRTPDDLRRLDPGLEGWEETRALLAAAGQPREVG